MKNDTASKWRGLCLFALTILLSTATFAAEMYNVEYLCADWGPAMTLPSKPGEKPQYSDAQEEVYFIKQVGSYTKGALGRKGHGINIYLCKMKSDGSAKAEIKELWHDVTYPISTQDQSTWMEVNRATHKIALSILFGGSDLTGLWTMNLDGNDLKRIIAPVVIDGRLQAFDSPSWTRDGQSIVFAESFRGAEVGSGRIAKCDKEGNHRVYLTQGPRDCQPRVSPDGTKIAFGVISETKGGLWIMDIGGDKAHPLPNPGDRLEGRHGGNYPAWSPDGNEILLHEITGTIIDATTGKDVKQGEPMCQGKRYTFGWAHWGRGGILGFTVAGIFLTDTDLKVEKALGLSHLAECGGRDQEGCRW